MPVVMLFFTGIKLSYYPRSSVPSKKDINLWPLISTSEPYSKVQKTKRSGEVSVYNQGEFILMSYLVKLTITGTGAMLCIQKILIPAASLVAD